MSTKYLFILLLCGSIVSLAGAISDPVMRTENYLNILAESESSNESLLLVAHEEYHGGWEKLTSLPKQDYSNLRISSKNLSDFNPAMLLKRESDAIDANRLNSDILYLDIGRSNDYYLSRIDKVVIEKNKLSGDPGTNTAGLKYIYEKEKTSQWERDYGYYLSSSDDEQQIAYPDRSIAVNSHEWNDQILPYSPGIEENELKTSASPGLHLSDQEHIVGLLENSIEYPPHAMSAVLTDEDIYGPADYETLINSYSRNRLSDIGNTYIPEKLPTIKKKTSAPKNYAIVVGIDEYEDRMSLHSCANDARSVADLMSQLGYNVVLLSDQTERKPTKHNILNVALKEIQDEPDLGNVIFYFSGHGSKAYNDTFYLIPQDADGSTSSYISEDEIKQQIKDLKNLALIIDACDSEGLSPVIGEGQLIIASSRYNESSNEEWIGSLSVFTSNLIKAIKEERARSKKVLLQRCFDKAYNDTIKWSRSRFMSQTPILTDLTNGKYYIN